jgi:catechol 2,3-dioxygenase-like lactoylglutathione lyase family enzyme
VTRSRGKPTVSIGHVILHVADPRRGAAFYKALGMRTIWEADEMAILELRGGTHLMLFKAKRKPRGKTVNAFDLMVENADRFHAELKRRRVKTTAVRDTYGGHRMFELTDPDGHVLTVLSDHTEGRDV